MVRLAACAAVAAALTIAGCGGANKASMPSLAEGARVFASSCSGCHTLQPSKTGPVRQGGPLVGAHLTAAQIESFTREMPVRRPLSDRELRAVVAYVAHAQRAGGPKK